MKKFFLSLTAMMIMGSMAASSDNQSTHNDMNMISSRTEVPQAPTKHEAPGEDVSDMIGHHEDECATQADSKRKCGHGLYCGCPGFKPINIVNNALRCKNCGHHRNYHRN